MPSNLVATVLQNYISSYEGRLDKNEQRPSNYGALKLAQAQTADPASILDAQVAANIEKSFNVSVQVPVVNYKDITIGNVRSCALQTNGLTSALVTLTAVTYVWGFLAYPEQHYENYVSYQQAINKLMEAGLQKHAATIDAAVINQLETQKNQYFPQAMLDFYPQVANAFQVAQAVKNDFYNKLNSILETADFMGKANILTNPIGMPMVNRYTNQGQYNATNEAFQFIGYDWNQSNRVVNGGAPIESTLYAVAPGSIAMKGRVDPAAKRRARIHESKYWDILPNAPYLNMDLGVFYQADCADASAIQASGLANSTRTPIESWEFSHDVFYISPYNSDPVNRYNPIFKAEILD
jgi:hypothetical protein